MYVLYYITDIDTTYISINQVKIKMECNTWKKTVTFQIGTPLK